MQTIVPRPETNEDRNLERNAAIAAQVAHYGRCLAMTPMPSDVVGRLVVDFQRSLMATFGFTVPRACEDGT